MFPITDPGASESLTKRLVEVFDKYKGFAKLFTINNYEKHSEGFFSTTIDIANNTKGNVTYDIKISHYNVSGFMNRDSLERDCNVCVTLLHPTDAEEDNIIWDAQPSEWTNKYGWGHTNLMTSKKFEIFQKNGSFIFSFTPTQGRYSQKEHP
eukprot:Awhi_evm1s11220